LEADVKEKQKDADKYIIKVFNLKSHKS